MRLSKYEILSSAKLFFGLSFKCNKKQITHFKEYECDNIDGSWVITTVMKPYAEAKIELAKLISLINNHAETEWNNSLHVHISFEENISKIYHINPLKMILSFDEDYLYDLFPDKKNRIGSRSVSELIKPGVNKDTVSTALENANNIYGIDLSRKGNNEIAYRYIGGKDYHKKYNEISSLIDTWITYTYSVIENPEYTQEEMSKLSALAKNNVSLDSSFISYESFAKSYKNIVLMVDLKDIKGYDSIYWPTIKDKVFEFVKSTKMSENIRLTMNYDSDSGKLQVKDSKLFGVSGLNGVELIECSISGDISNASLYYCDVINTNADFCNFFTGCSISRSEISNCYISDNVEVKFSNIRGDSTIANGNLTDCSLSKGVKYTKHAKLKDCNNDGIKI